MMKRIFIPLFLVMLILATSAPGYCYTNMVAKKTNVPNSEYKSLIQTGMTTGAKIGLGTGTVLGAGVASGIGTYVVIQVTSGTVSAAPAALTASGILAKSGSLTLGELNALWLGSEGPLAAGGAASATSVAAPYLAAAGVATVVIVVTATCIFLIWSAS